MTEDNIKRIDKMQAILRNMKTDMKRQQKLSAINSMELTPKQASKRNADADWTCEATDCTLEGFVEANVGGMLQ